MAWRAVGGVFDLDSVETDVSAKSARVHMLMRSQKSCSNPGVLGVSLSASCKLRAKSTTCIGDGKVDPLPVSVVE